ncbi:MAG: DNRLRE domain-containing protein, partial [Ardenticatenales bacterium]
MPMPPLAPLTNSRAAAPLAPPIRRRPPARRRLLAAAAFLIPVVAAFVVSGAYGTAGRVAVGGAVDGVRAAADVDTAHAAAQPGVIDVRMTPIADTTLARNRATTPLGLEPTLSLGRQLAPDDNAEGVLLRFGLVDVDPGGLVVTATLTLTRLGGLGAASVLAGLGSISEPFDERTATWANRPDIARNGLAVYVPAAPGEQRFDVAWAVEEALRAQRNLGLQIEVPAGGCEGGRGRTFSSRESAAGAPELRLAYVGAGTPHPFPSPTPSDVPTWTATPTGTRPPTATATPTSDRPQPRPPDVIEPVPGAVLPPPEGVDAWVVRWRQFAPTLCSYRIDLSGPTGIVYTTDIPNTHATCHSVTAASPGMPPDLAEGAYTWRIRSTCPPFEPQEAQSPP